MNIIELNLDKWYKVTLSFNWILVIVVAAGVYGLIMLIKWLQGKRSSSHLKLKKVEINVQGQSFEFELDYKLQSIAYKIWVELSTRKIGLQYEDDKDVIVEVYNSWYSAFGIIRTFMEEIPVDEVANAKPLIDATMKVLNNELRPHLTEWQAKFRKWYDEALEEDKGKTSHRKPQEIQKDYPEYNALVKDLKKTNNEMISYCKQLETIAFRK